MDFRTLGREATGPLERPARKSDFGRTRPIPCNLDVVPVHPPRDAGAERLRARLLGGETAREEAGGVPAIFPGGDLVYREQPLQIPDAASLYCVGGAFEFVDVRSDADDQNSLLNRTIYV
ncbi:hypothetical protein JOH49_004069 [Bradyrhizobium elkanii]|uniref:Uncharacterized protein n=1 Tax=Bradyrhizobium elkanii TaxID=29448 RepID=A0A8I1Y6J3_BRAEL|nr:hypothetical protein [Bradyrhizobium elkanii]